MFVNTNIVTTDVHKLVSNAKIMDAECATKAKTIPKKGLYYYEKRI